MSVFIWSQLCILSQHGNNSEKFYYGKTTGYSRKLIMMVDQL